MRSAVDTVIIRALRHGMDPASDVRFVAVELVAAAGGRRSVLRAALARTERALAERASGVGQRARDALRQALAVATPTLAATDRGTEATARPAPLAGVASLSG